MSAAAVVTAVYGGVHEQWPSQWTEIPGLNDADDALSDERMDFVGDANDPGGLYASSANYLYIRMRVDDGTVVADDWNDAVYVLIDRTDVGTANQPDYGFVWDSFTDHGLEMMIPDTGSNSKWDKWSNSRMDDIDGVGNLKQAPPDFGTDNGDGFIRTVSEVSTGNFGTTTFIDFAASWDYLAAQTSLAPGQTWRIQFGANNNSQDHANIDYDVAAFSAPDDAGISFGSAFTVVPEPEETAVVVGAVMVGLILVREHRRRSLTGPSA